jgi:hypothetical protein
MDSLRFHIIAFSFLALSIQGLIAQSFEDFQKQEKARMLHVATEQQKSMDQKKKEYADYVAKRDQEWLNYLKKEWSAFQSFKAVPVPEKPKPKRAPVFEPKPKPETRLESTPIHIPESSPTAEPAKLPVSVPYAKPKTSLESGTIPISSNPSTVKPEQTPIPFPIQPLCKPAEPEEFTKEVEIPFYGKSFTLRYDPALAKITAGTINKKVIVDFWEKASASNYTLAVERLLKTKAILNINDYGYLMLIQKFTDLLYPSAPNGSRLLTWFLLVRSGYSLRVAYQNDEVALLIPTHSMVYQKPYLTIDQTRYYIFPNVQGNTFNTYEEDYQKGRIFDFNIKSPISFSGRKVCKTFTFNFNEKQYSVLLDYDPDLISFYNDYPTLNFEVYFDAVTSIQSRESILTALKPIVSGMDELQATNFLLRFVQTAFSYKTDPEQFGREKYFFAEEVFYYPYCDCEDRSVLFSYLVRELLGLKVVGLEYPGHIATAVALRSEVAGDYLTFAGDRYVLADPTFINAPVGMSMPDLKNISPIVRKTN